MFEGFAAQLFFFGIENVGISGADVDAEFFGGDFVDFGAGDF